MGQNQKKKTVFVGLSGGVDSSVAALRLKKEGYNIVGVFIKVWHPDFLVCDWERERLDAMRVAAHLEIPFLTFDAEAVYKREVADYMIAEYKRGRTPNPDVMCNRHVKFGAFLTFAKAHGADYVATGHYARVKKRKDGTVRLLRGTDHSKDQSYFLWMLTQDELSNILFPLGASQKEEVRREAKEHGLPTAKKRDSQGICFLGKIDLKEFLSHYISEKPGEVLDQTGNVIGCHDGAFFYTIGQRHGFTVTAEQTKRAALYVIDKDLEKNTITVATEVPPTTDDTVRLESVNHIQRFNAAECVEAEFRYHQRPFPVTITTTQGDHATLVVPEDIQKPSVGQSCVLYRGDECIGGGVITE